MPTPQFEHFIELWNDVLQPALRDWHSMTPTQRDRWAHACPPDLKNAMTFFLVHRLYGPHPDAPDTTPNTPT